MWAVRRDRQRYQSAWAGAKRDRRHARPAVCAISVKPASGPSLFHFAVVAFRPRLDSSAPRSRARTQDRRPGAGLAVALDHRHGRWSAGSASGSVADRVNPRMAADVCRSPHRRRRWRPSFRPSRRLVLAGACAAFGFSIGNMNHVAAADHYTRVRRGYFTWFGMSIAISRSLFWRFVPLEWDRDGMCRNSERRGEGEALSLGFLHRASKLGRQRDRDVGSYGSCQEKCKVEVAAAPTGRSHFEGMIFPKSSLALRFDRRHGGTEARQQQDPGDCATNRNEVCRAPSRPEKGGMTEP